eukprot:3733509-Amphidinium_carterae.1
MLAKPIPVAGKGGRKPAPPPLKTGKKMPLACHFALHCQGIAKCSGMLCTTLLRGRASKGAASNVKDHKLYHRHRRNFGAVLAAQAVLHAQGLTMGHCAY